LPIRRELTDPLNWTYPHRSCPRATLPGDYGDDRLENGTASDMTINLYAAWIAFLVLFIWAYAVLGKPRSPVVGT